MEYSILTKRGERPLNEDSAGAGTEENSQCFVLCDGLGGHDKGEVASGLCVEYSLKLFHREKLALTEGTNRCLERCFSESQQALLDMQKTDFKYHDMKTTMTMLVRSGNDLQWGHVGDSRLYYFKGGKLVLRTLDHSVPQMLVASGELKESDIRHHEDRNRLLKVMGMPWNRPKYELSRPITLEAGQAFLLCSDGFWEWITEDRMEALLSAASTPGEWLSMMEREILSNGTGKGMDNYTAIAVFGEKPAKASFFGRLFGKKS